MSWALSDMGRRSTDTYLWASSLISTQLLSRANRGASGNAATNTVTKPYWTTAKESSEYSGLPLPSIDAIHSHFCHSKHYFFKTFREIGINSNWDNDWDRYAKVHQHNIMAMLMCQNVYVLLQFPKTLIYVSPVTFSNLNFWVGGPSHMVTVHHLAVCLWSFVRLSCDWV